MADLIDMEKLLDQFLNLYAVRNPEQRAIMDKVCMMLIKAPNVDAVEIIRCKDCINYNTDNCCDGYGWCENLGIGVHDNFFCKIGERKTNGE